MIKALLAVSALLCLSPLSAGEPVETANLVNPLMIGAPLPELTLNNQHGEAVNLGKIAAEKNAVIVFYRGSW